MKRKLLPILFVSIAVFFASCGNSFSEKPNNKTGEKAIVSFSTILNSDSASSDKTARATVVNPVKLLTTAIDKIELSIYTVEKGEEIPYVYDDSKEEDKNIVVFNTDVIYVDDKNGGSIPNGEEYAINLFEKAEFEFDPAYVYSFYVNLFCKDEADNYECVQSGELEEVELQTGNNELTFETKFAEAGNVAFVVTWNPADEEQNRETYEARVSSVKFGLFTGDDLENLSEVEDFKMTEFEVQSEIDEEEGFVKYYFANYAVKEVPNGHYQICVELYDKKNNLLNRFYYPLWVYGYKSVGSKALFNDYTRHYFIEYVYDEDVNIVSGKEDAFVNYFTPNSKIYLPDVNCIEHEGYNFQGWYTSSTFEDDALIKVIDAPALANNNDLKDFVVYAKWIPIVDNTTTGSIIFNDENIGYTITMTIDEPFTLTSGSASFDFVLADGTDLVSSGILANALEAQNEEEMFPMVDLQLYYGGKAIINFAEDEENSFFIYTPSMEKEIDPEDLAEGESLYTKPKISVNPAVPLEAPGKYQILAGIMNNMQSIVVEFFDITVENKIVYEEKVTENSGNISQTLSNILKNRTHAEVSVKVSGEGFDDSRSPEGVVTEGTIHQIASSLLNVGIFEDNNISIDLSELTGVTSVPERCFYNSNSEIGKDFSSIILPEGITKIGEHAFSECTSLSSVSLPASLTSIGSYAFYGCSNLSDITVAEDSINYIVRKDKEATVPTMLLVEKASDSNSGDTIIWQWFPADVEDITLDYSNELYSGIKAIGKSVYQNNKQIKEIKSFGDIVLVGSSAFRFASELSKINLDGVKFVEECAFYALSSDCQINAQNCSLCGIYGVAFDYSYEFNINFPTDASYYVLDSDNIEEEADTWWAEYKAGILAGTMTTETFEHLDWYDSDKFVLIQDGDPEEISIPYTDPRHSQYGWEPDPENPDDTPPEDEFISDDGVPAWKVFQNDYFNDSSYIQFIVPNN